MVKVYLLYLKKMSYSRKKRKSELIVWLYATQAMWWFELKDFEMCDDEIANEQLKDLIYLVKDKLYEINVWYMLRHEKFLFDIPE